MHKSSSLLIQLQKLSLEKQLEKKILESQLIVDSNKLKSLPMQGRLYGIDGADYLLSQNICRNFRLGDNLVQFWYRARHNVLPCKYTLSRWYANKNPTCSLDGYNLESMSHVLSGCKKFGNNYSKRHDRVVEKSSEELTSDTEIYVNKLFSTTFREFKENQYAATWKPDIAIKTGNNILIINVACPYDLYIENTYKQKLTTTNARRRF